MRINWVLSDEERNRRFNKLRKSRNNIVMSNPSVLYLAFSEEEEKILKDLASKFQVPWLQNFSLLDKNAGINYIEYAFGWKQLKFMSWETFKYSMGLNFNRYILPKFSELKDLSFDDVDQIMKSPHSGIAQFFRSCHIMNMEEKIAHKVDCHIVSQVRF